MISVNIKNYTYNDAKSLLLFGTFVRHVKYAYFFFQITTFSHVFTATVYSYNKKTMRFL